MTHGSLPMPAKTCQHAGCQYPCARHARYCPKHCGAVLAALRASSAYRTDDQSGPPRGGTAEVAYEAQMKSDD